MKTSAILFTVGLTLAALSPAADTNDDNSWIADVKGCKIWSPRPQPNESVTWSGECRDGYAEGPGVAQWQRAGEIGTRLDSPRIRGKANGRGVMSSPSGLRYEGDFSDDKLSGKGIFTSPEGNRYEGDFLDGKREGTGKQVYADGSYNEGEWKDDKPAHPERIVQKSYSINEIRTGSKIAHDVVSRIAVPVGKTYAELTADEKRRVKSLYEPMAEDDEPPYPLHGLRTIMDSVAKIQNKLLVRGELTLAVNVNASGKAVSVEVLRSPDIAMAKAIATVLMLQDYKPAICRGSPCNMQYPIRIDFTVSQ